MNICCEVILDRDLEQNIESGSDIEVDLTILDLEFLKLIWFQHVSTICLNGRCQLLARGVHSGVVGGNGRSLPPGPGSCTQPGKTEAGGPCAIHLWIQIYPYSRHF